MTMQADDEIVGEFLIESHENLDRMEGDLLDLEKDPTATSKLSSIFRAIHTIKGTCGFLGFKNLEAVTHTGESLLCLLRDEELEYSSDIASGLLALVDAVKDMLTLIETTRNDGDSGHEELIARLRRLQRGEPAVPEGPPAPAPARASSSLHPVGPAPGQASARPAETPRRGSVTLCPVPPATPPTAPDATSAQPPPAGGSHAPALSEASVRVDVVLLDKLMNLVGELVLARNQILQYASSQTASTFVAATQRLNLITADLQEGVMKTRMQAIGNLFSKFPRVVRDLAHSCGKKIRCELEGEDTELDRTLLEAIKDPLAHLVRNAVDHGIEDPAVRVAAGKPAEGVIKLRAFHAGGQVNVEISEDGHGIDCEKIKAKALARGLITADRAHRMSERELTSLIFMPGFSTADKVTNVSGRGVGMDVVKTNVERIGGMVDVESRPGLGTLFRVKIPLTLAIIPAVIVACGEERYAIPQISLLEIVHFAAGVEGEVRGIEWMHGTPVYRLRGQLLPLVHLGNLLYGTPLSADDSVNIVVLSVDNRAFGLVVDGVHDTADIVVKPLGAHLKGIPAFAGATILGDGSVALILDVLGLAKLAGVIGEERGAGAAGDDDARAAAQVREQEALLLCKTESGGRVAVRLALVSRLEKILAVQVERVGHEEVVQYRGEVMPLVRLAALLPDGGDHLGVPKETLDVVVCSAGGRRVGLIVEEVLDIVRQEIVIARRGTRPGVLGSVVLDGRVTELLDLEQLHGVTAGALGEAPHASEAA